MSSTDWQGFEEVLLGEETDDEWIEFISSSTPDYMYEHWQNSNEAQTEIQEYIAERNQEEY